MVYGFVRQSGGHVHIDSKVGEGTVVHVYLPLTSSAAKPKEEGELQPLPKIADVNVLLVEDDGDVSNVVQEQLETLGYTVRSVTNGQEALSLLRSSEKFDLLLSDVILPGGMSGFAIARMARKLAPGIGDRKSTRLNSSHSQQSRMPSSA